MRDDLLEITAKLTRFVKKSFCLPLPVQVDQFCEELEVKIESIWVP